jgi:hypothetical protein
MKKDFIRKRLGVLRKKLKQKIKTKKKMSLRSRRSSVMMTVEGKSRRRESQA